MINFRNIFDVATYERKTLYRSWFFRIFAIITLLFIFFQILGMFAHKWASWSIMAISANLPYISVLFVNVAQAVIAVFLASEFLRRDKKLDTTEVIYARPISNGEYVVGKTLGIVILFGGLLIVVMAITLFYNIIIKTIPITWEAYVLYPLLISVPTLVFILGLSFFLMILFRSQAITFIVLLGYIGLAVFYFKDKLYGILDYMAFNLPMVWSDFIHFGDVQMILLHRLAYLFLGFGFIFATIRFISRLPQTGKWNLLNLTGFVVFVGLGLFAAFTFYTKKDKEYQEREEYLALNNIYVNYPVADVVSNHLNVEHKGSGLKVASSLFMQNPTFEPIDTLILSLNPNFKIDSIIGQAGPVTFIKESHILKIIPENPLAFMQSIGFTVYYSGKPGEAIANLDIPKDDIAMLKKLVVANLDKKPFIVDDNYMLLTAESIWYPIAGAGFNTKNFQTSRLDFVRFSLEVQPEEGLTVIAPGMRGERDGNITFFPETNLSSLPLIIGEFEQRTMEIQGVEYNLFLKPGHDFFSQHFTYISDSLESDTLEYIINDLKEDFEYDELDLYYPFNRINIVEVPIQYHAYERPYKQEVDFILPEMILIPEKGAGMVPLDFRRFKNMMEMRNRERNNSSTPEKIEVDMLQNFLRNTFFRSEIEISGGFRGEGNQESVIQYNSDKKLYTRNPFNLFPLYYTYMTGIVSDEYPVFDAMIALYLKEGFEVSIRQGFRGGITENEKANIALKGRGITSVFEEYDSELSYAAIYQAGSFVLTSLRNKVGAAEFDNFLYYYLEDHAFTAIDFRSMAREFEREFGERIEPYLQFLISGEDLPEFVVSTPEYIQTRDDIGDVYVIRTSVTNKGGSRGLIEFSFMISGGGGFGGGGGESEQKLFEIDSGETVDLQMVFYDQPRLMTVNTLISGNIPATFSNFLRSAEEKTISNLEEYVRFSNRPVNFVEEGEVIIDNEDEGFSYISVSNESKIKQFLNSKKEKTNELEYIQMSTWWNPPVWRPVAHSAMYGETIRSAMITRRGDGGNKARWETILDDQGFYDVFVYIPVSAMYRFGGGRSRGSGDSRQRGGEHSHGPRFADEGTNYNYIISSNEGTEEVEFTLRNPEDGWNRIGTFHFPADTVKIELSNLTNGSRIIADAVKLEIRE
ncbi:hypothetical protein ACFLT1_01580 [Bacteroidota bacterium]